MKKRCFKEVYFLSVALLLVLFASCSVFSKQTGSATFAISKDVMRSAIQQSESLINKSDLDVLGSDFETTYTFEVSLFGGYEKTGIKEYKKDDWDKLKEEDDDKTPIIVAEFPDIPVGSTLYAEAKISYTVKRISDNSEFFTWDLYKGTSDDITIEEGPNDLPLTLKLVPREDVEYTVEVYLETEFESGEYKIDEERTFTEKLSVAEDFNADSYAELYKKIISAAFVEGYTLNLDKAEFPEVEDLVFGKSNTVKLYFDKDQEIIPEIEFKYNVRSYIQKTGTVYNSKLSLEEQTDIFELVKDSEDSGTVVESEFKEKYATLIEEYKKASEDGFVYAGNTDRFDEKYSEWNFNFFYVRQTVTYNICDEEGNVVSSVSGLFGEDVSYKDVKLPEGVIGGWKVTAKTFDGAEKELESISGSDFENTDYVQFLAYESVNFVVILLPPVELSIKIRYYVQQNDAEGSYKKASTTGDTKVTYAADSSEEVISELVKAKVLETAETTYSKPAGFVFGEITLGEITTEKENNKDIYKMEARVNCDLITSTIYFVNDGETVGEISGLYRSAVSFDDISEDFEKDDYTFAGWTIEYYASKDDETPVSADDLISGLPVSAESLKSVDIEKYPAYEKVVFKTVWNEVPKASVEVELSYYLQTLDGEDYEKTDKTETLKISYPLAELMTLVKENPKELPTLILKLVSENFDKEDVPEGYKFNSVKDAKADASGIAEYKIKGSVSVYLDRTEVVPNSNVNFTINILSVEEDNVSGKLTITSDAENGKLIATEGFDSYEWYIGSEQVDSEYVKDNELTMPKDITAGRYQLLLVVTSKGESYSADITLEIIN
ncbi:MAG: hypothetical protein K6A43_01895 [Treponema sp.]|nr:hypothetical protein [Treponema sp.]